MAQAGPRHEVRCIRLGELPEWDPKARVVADTDPNRDRDVILSVKDLNVFYGQSHVVHDVSFDVARREVVALVGESGSARRPSPQRGWDPRPVGGLNRTPGRGCPGVTETDRRAKQRASYIFQNPYHR